jgi:hypothetical protein
MIKRLLIASLITVVSAGTTLSFTSAAEAGGINHRQTNQQKRIDQGVRNGSLTPREIYRLQRQQANINAREARYKSDSKFSRGERRDLNHRLNRASKNIYHKKHN